MYEIFQPDGGDVRNSYIEMDGEVRRIANAARDMARRVGPNQAINEMAHHMLTAYQRHAAHTAEAIEHLKKQIATAQYCQETTEIE